MTTPAVPSPEVREAAGAVRDEVWGALTPRGIALPVLACGGCLIGAGALTWGTSQTLGTAGTAGNLQGPNDTTAAALGVAGTFAGGLMVLLGVPVLLGGEVAALFAAVSDATAIGNALVVEDGLLTALAAGRAGAWLVSSQSLACGSGLCAAGGLGFLLHNVASGTSLAYDKGGAPILAELNNNAGLYALLGAVPVGLACASSLAALGADFGTVMVADPLAGEAEAEAEEASSSRPRRGDDGARLAARLQDAPIAY